MSVFAIIILSVIANMYSKGHEEFTGGINDPKPEDGKAVAGTIFTAVIVYAVRPASHVPTECLNIRLTDCFSLQAFLVFCGCQGLLHVRESRRGAIAL